MFEEEWDRVTFYTATDANGNLVTDTSKLLSDCQTSEGKKSCWITLGHYENYEELGLSTAW